MEKNKNNTLEQKFFEINGTKFVDEFSKEIYEQTYRYGNETIDETQHRVAKDLARVEKDQEFWTNQFQWALENFKFVPGGRITSNAGTGLKGTTYINCFVDGFDGFKPTTASKDILLAELAIIEQQILGETNINKVASAIRSSPSALATEQFEKNLANGIGTFFMGGSNILASSGWAAFDSWLDYQGSEVQEAIAGVQFLAILIQLRHGNIKAAEELIEGQGYKSFKAFKRAMGSAGEGNAWHHIVEQRGNNISLFGAETIHNTNNLIKLPHGAGSIHAKVSGFYSSKQAFTGGQTVRQWLSTQSYQQQYDFGIKTLKQFGWTP